MSIADLAAIQPGKPQGLQDAGDGQGLKTPLAYLVRQVLASAAANFEKLHRRIIVNLGL
jgi:hypothetical protein